ncbi:MAG: transglycosylase SLT domain-containing protein [Desulfobacteraceae bacterium]|nr:transglycosylase SLT domain-containing protein [Desulfobacteraceae bacterium]
MKNIIIVLCGILLTTSAAFAEPVKDNAFASYLLSNTRITGPLDFCGEKVPIDDPEIRENLEKEMLLFLGDPAQVILWLKRASRYMPYIERMLKQNNMPDDLKYVAVIESSLLPHAGSVKHAIGFWQFIQETGQRYGMNISSEIDERRSIFTSTIAAIRYFKKLYDDFGSWTLAAAGYNMGEAGLKNNIAFQETNDYYRLYLPLETQRYIFRIVAAKLILSDPKKYGFHLERDDLYAPADFDRVQIECPEDMPVTVIAKAANTYFKTIKDLNPEIRGKAMPGGSHSILIPKGSGDGFASRYANLLSQFTPVASQQEIRPAQLAQPEPDDQPIKIKKENRAKAKKAALMPDILRKNPKSRQNH